MNEAKAHMMLDVETWATGARPVLVEVGAVVFDPEGELLGDGLVGAPTLYAQVDPQSCINLGFEVDADTIRFWLQQDAEGRTRISSPVNQKMIHLVLNELAGFMVQHCVKYVWAHGASFDPVIINEYCRRLRRTPLFDHKDIRDTRTLFSYAANKFTAEQWAIHTRRVVKHHPTHDAWGQARAVQACLREETNETSAITDISGSRIMVG